MLIKRLPSLNIMLLHHITMSWGGGEGKGGKGGRGGGHCIELDPSTCCRRVCLCRSCLTIIFLTASATDMIITELSSSIMDKVR